MKKNWPVPMVTTNPPPDSGHSVSASVRQQQHDAPEWPDEMQAAWFKWQGTPDYAARLCDVAIQARPAALRWAQAAFAVGAESVPERSHSGWVPVGERQPPPWNEVAVAINGERKVGFVTSLGAWYEIFEPDDSRPAKVTHWFDVPPPPPTECPTRGPSPVAITLWRCKCGCQNDERSCACAGCGAPQPHRGGHSE